MYSIDRIEGGHAVLEKDGKTLDVPLSGLPDGIREGDLLEQTPDGWHLRRDAAERRRHQLAERRRRLLEGKP